MTPTKKRLLNSSRFLMIGLFLFLEDVLESRNPEVTWNSIHHDWGNVALDERLYIGDEFVSYISAVRGDPFSWNQSGVVGDFVYVLDGCI